LQEKSFFFPFFFLLLKEKGEGRPSAFLFFLKNPPSGQEMFFPFPPFFPFSVKGKIFFPFLFSLVLGFLLPPFSCGGVGCRFSHFFGPVFFFPFSERGRPPLFFPGYNFLPLSPTPISLPSWIKGGGGGGGFFVFPPGGNLPPFGVRRGDFVSSFSLPQGVVDDYPSKILFSPPPR